MQNRSENGRGARVTLGQPHLYSYSRISGDLFPLPMCLHGMFLSTCQLYRCLIVFRHKYEGTCIFIWHKTFKQRASNL
jgi:hypothetical protein